MFPARAYPVRYFPTRYFPKVGGAGVPPAVDTSYHGDMTAYDGAGATGSISGATVLAIDTVYDTAGATGSTSGATILPSETSY